MIWRGTQTQFMLRLLVVMTCFFPSTGKKEKSAKQRVVVGRHASMLYDPDPAMIRPKLTVTSIALNARLCWGRTQEND